MQNRFVGIIPGIATARQGPKAQDHDNSDAVLIAKIAAGNRLAMQVLYARHHARVYRFILRLIGSQAAAEDLTSDVFLGVWRQAHRFEARSSVTTWLLAIARYKALAELRRRPQPSSDEASAEISDPSGDPEASLEIKHRGEIVRNCLTRLSARHREIIDLVYNTKNRCRRRPISSACPAIRSKRACSTRARSYPRCSPRRASWTRRRSPLLVRLMRRRIPPQR
jgi:RNA polymerase sigma-70 factor, ECF subfamily